MYNTKMEKTSDKEVRILPVGLVLEGGGTRGAYTAGVLDVFLQEGIRFPCVYGVSAGACNAISYISGQYKRNYNIFYQYLRDKRYLSISSLLTTGSIFGFDFIFGELSQKLLPLDYEAFHSSTVRFRVGVTDLNSGQPYYFEKEDVTDRMEVVRASSSMPFVSKVVHFAGKHLLDGGIADPIPMEQSIQDGNHLNVVVLTRDLHYQKSKPDFPRPLLRAAYPRYPRLADAIARRPQRYNALTKLCRRQEDLGNAVVIRPSRPIMVSRYEKDPERLVEIYQMGIADTQEKLRSIDALLNAKDKAEPLSL